MKYFIPCVSCFILLAAIAGTAQGAGIMGDERAQRQVDLMLETMGGKSLWANARSIHTMERARNPRYGDGIMASYWYDLEQPGEHGVLSHPEVDVEYAWTRASGWIKRADEIRDYNNQELGDLGDDWRVDMYTLLHRLAAGEVGLTVRDLGDNGVRVLDDKDRKMADFRLTADGHLYYWATYHEKYHDRAPQAFVYGPYRQFGSVNFPDWGTSVDGKWSFYFLQVSPSVKPFAEITSIKRPRHWQGGALHPAEP